MTKLKQLKIVLVLSMVMFFLGNVESIHSLELEGKIHKNVYIENINLSGFTKTEARSKINEIIKTNNELKLYFEEKTYKVNLKELNIIYDVDDMINEAYSVGREKGLISSIKTKVKLDLGEIKTIKYKYSYENKSIENYISYIQEELEKEPIDATIKIEDGTRVIEKETYGIKIDVNKLQEILISKIDKLFYEEEKIPTISVKPMHVYDELCKIDTILGTYETYFNKNKMGRVNNIYVAAEATNNILLSPSEEFSFNKYTCSKDFISHLQKAPVIKNGNVEEGLGGGICQVSTTIYNAALYAGLEITNIRNHTIPSGYIEKGRDATVSYGELDLKFKNKFKTPILIYNKVYDDRIVSDIYGNKEDKQDIEIVTEMVNTFDNKTKTIESNKLYLGEEEIKEKGRLGYKINTFRVYKKGKELIKEFIHESYYPPMDKEILKGIKEKEIKNSSTFLL